MKIKNIEVYSINYPLPTDKKNPSPWNPVIVKVNTDEGLYGLGEAGMAYCTGSTAAFGMCQDLARMAIGRDPMKIELFWENMFKKTFWGQGGGTVVFSGMSAIDMALWDIKGKALGVPVYQLLGGKCRDKLRTYASQLQFGWNTSCRQSLGRAEDYAAAARDAVREGYDAIKVDVLWWDINGNRMDNCVGLLNNNVLCMAEKRIAAIREAVGEAVDIIVECHAYTDTTNSVQLGRIFEKYNVLLMEEVNTPLNTKLTRSVMEKINIPLAAGERTYSRWGYLPFFNDRSLDVIQPDLGNCGGITEGKKIADMAHVFDITVQAHVCGSPLATAAALQFEAAIPNFFIHEHHRNNRLAPNRELCIYDYQPVNGYYEVPELPGLGQDFSDKFYAMAQKIVIE